MLWVLLVQVSVDSWIRRLGDEDYEVREAAHAYLDALGPVAEGALRIGARSPDPEIRARVGSLLRTIEGDRGTLYFVRQGNLVACAPDGTDGRLIAEDVDPLFGLSPDCRSLVYYHREEFWLARANGSEAHAVNVCRPTELTAWSPLAMLWAPDGRKVYFKLSEERKEYHCGGWEPRHRVVELNLETGDEREIGFLPRWAIGPRRAPELPLEDVEAFERAECVASAAPVYSPGGRRVAFLDGTDLYSGNADGTGIRVIAWNVTPTSSLFWSPHR